jgi:hypothetical protein
MRLEVALPGFPGVHVTTETTFAYDVGTQVRIVGWSVDGASVPWNEAYQRWVAGREDGVVDAPDAMVAWVRGVVGVQQRHFLGGDQLLGRRTPTGEAFHPLRVERLDAEGRSWCVVSGFVREHTSQLGNHFTRRVFAFDRASGWIADRALDGGPEPLAFSERDLMMADLDDGR